MYFKLTSKPRMLALSTFSWNENDVSRQFHTCKTAEDFIQTFHEVSPSVLESPEATKSKGSDLVSELLPASKKARLESSAQSSKVDEKLFQSEMDITIEKHFEGIHCIPSHLTKQYFLSCMHDHILISEFTFYFFM